MKVFVLEDGAERIRFLLERLIAHDVTLAKDAATAIAELTHSAEVVCGWGCLTMFAARVHEEEKRRARATKTNT